MPRGGGWDHKKVQRIDYGHELRLIVPISIRRISRSLTPSHERNIRVPLPLGRILKRLDGSYRIGTEYVLYRHVRGGRMKVTRMETRVSFFRRRRSGTEKSPEPSHDENVTSPRFAREIHHLSTKRVRSYRVMVLKKLIH